MRLFIAIELESHHNFFRQHTPSLSKHMRPPAAYHLTLKFLGDIPQEKLTDIIAKLKTVSFEAFNVTFDHTGFFIYPEKTVVWAGVKHKKEVIYLKRAIENAMVDFVGRDGDFQPHVTLAKIRKKIPVHKTSFDKPLTIRVHSFSLIKSELSAQGAVYETLRTFDLEKN